MWKRRRGLTLILCTSLIVWRGVTSPIEAQAFSDDPNETVWNLFAQINQPQSDGRTSKWETWATADDLFPAPPGTPAWPSAAIRSKVFEALEQQIGLLMKVSGDKFHSLSLQVDVSQSSEVHLNCPTFAFVVTNKYWYSNTLLTKAAAVQAGSDIPIKFPMESIVVKAKWRPLNGGDDASQFHIGTDQKGDQWVLLGIHLTSKIVPNWFWATWEHVSNPKRPPSDDSFGFPNGSSTPSPGLAKLFQQYKLGKEWPYYRLNGPQTDYLSPKLRGNSVIEGALLPTASCMTCHARAALTKDDAKLSQVDAHGQGYTGTPLPSWYSSGSSDVYMQTDFLWSLIVRPYYFANPGSATPPDCTKIP